MTNAAQKPMEESPNFGFLSSYQPILVQYAAQAEKYVFDDPNTCLIQLSQFIELLAQQSAVYFGFFLSRVENLVYLPNLFRFKGILYPDAVELFHGIRKAGNLAVGNHAGSQRSKISIRSTFFYLRRISNVAINKAHSRFPRQSRDSWGG